MKTKIMDYLLDDEFILQDAIMSQKYMLERYNTGVYESESPIIKEALMNLLLDEHQIESDLLSELQKRDWYQIIKSNDNQMKQIKDQYLNKN
ncbi:spore coat protein [Paludicola sp. MB14-C6]|uniref:spore coat protein n=1 Tax=Paludihabitans sp. MB14-C6 TaxID=3070656 RepID=UPI0027DDD53E|nr:spore coat protein [Paludicola sp. MB14-C6]WMJ23321.1 spore coat protein [Paludicola sp. MB14-C6]